MVDNARLSSLRSDGVLTIAGFAAHDPRIRCSRSAEYAASGNTRTKTYEVPTSNQSLTYSYDADGNLSSKTDGSAAWTYEWNARNELKRVLRDGTEVARFAYDPLGRRAERVAGEVTFRYLYDGSDIIRETRTDSSGSPVTKWIHGPGIDEPLAREDASGSLQFLHADGLGLIVATTTSAGAVTSRITYDPWGNIETGTPNPYGFTGREWDTETGLWYYRARYYDAKQARFLSEDPIGFADGVNFYEYVRNSPISLRDPFGLQSMAPVVTTVTPPSIVQQGANKVFGYFLHGSRVPAVWIDAKIHAYKNNYDRDNWFDRALDSVSAKEAMLIGVVASLDGRPRARTTGNFGEVCRRLERFHGIDEVTASQRLHQIKAQTGRGPADNVIFDLTGNVYDEAGTLLGSLTQGGGKAW